MNFTVPSLDSVYCPRPCVFACVLTAVMLLFLPSSAFADAQAAKQLYETASQAFAEGNYDDAIGTFHQLIRMYPGFAPAYNS